MLFFIPIKIISAWQFLFLLAVRTLRSALHQQGSIRHCLILGQTGRLPCWYSIYCWYQYCRLLLYSTLPYWFCNVRGEGHY